MQSSRPVFNSSYNAPIYNYNDRQVSFQYKEFEPLVFNINQLESNLVALVSYHAYTIIGLDAASFEENGGDTYFEIAKQIDIYTSMFKELNMYYIDEVNPGELTTKSINYMLSNLDPYTTYIDGETKANFDRDVQGNFTGIGVQIRKDAVSEMLLVASVDC